MAGKKTYEVQLLAEGALTGILVGGAVSAFRWLLEAAEAVREMVYTWGRGACPVFFLWLLVLVLVAVFLRELSHRAPMAGGSGIPQVKGVLCGSMQMDWRQVLGWKFCGAILGNGLAGLSMGRQGPSVQFGACIGQGVSRLWSRAKLREQRFLMIAGAGAGLAAAFNAPLAGVVFCLEELAGRFSAMQALVGIVAAAAATAVSRSVFGAQPVFQLVQLPVVPLGADYGCFLLLGLFCGFLGLLFNRGLVFSLDLYDRSPLRGLARPLLPLLLAGVLGFVLPEILGGGNGMVDSLMVTEYSLWFLLLLLAGKYFFTLLCFGSGAPGGIFLPMMALGAAAGAVFAKALLSLGWLDPALVPCCIVFGMAGYFTGAVKSPVSSSILIMELTGSFDHMLGLLCVSLAACLVLDMTGTRPIYDAILQRSLQKQGR